MSNIFVFSQNLKLNSLERYTALPRYGRLYVFVTTHCLFENEKAYLTSLFGRCRFHTFADFLSDSEMADCDRGAWRAGIPYDLYLAEIRRQKNEIVSARVAEKYPHSRKYLLSAVLGIDPLVWKRKGWQRLKGEYYHPEDAGILQTGRLASRRLLARTPALKTCEAVRARLRRSRETPYFSDEVFVGFYQGRKYVFLGNKSRIDYRLAIHFESSPEECCRLNAGKYEPRENCTYMTTWHERHKCRVPNDERYAVRWAQDGYLPANYSHFDYFFKPANVVYYCWDELGTRLFRNLNLPYEMIPFRKKLYLPEPEFPREIRHVLVAASGAGDWTALKNRSDDDLLVEAAVWLARRFPEIRFTFRCHPAWVHPRNAGVHSIERVGEYFQRLGLENLLLSAHIPAAGGRDDFQYSFSRSSLAEDLAGTDFVIGEHSISMIDAAFQGIPFCSVNLTKRRNFFDGISGMGFPHCVSREGLAAVIDNVTEPQFQKGYRQAVARYNEMTDREG